MKTFRHIQAAQELAVSNENLNNADRRIRVTSLGALMDLKQRAVYSDPSSATQAIFHRSHEYHVGLCGLIPVN